MKSEARSLEPRPDDDSQVVEQGISEGTKVEKSFEAHDIRTTILRMIDFRYGLANVSLGKEDKIFNSMVSSGFFDYDSVKDKVFGKSMDEIHKKISDLINKK